MTMDMFLDELGTIFDKRPKPEQLSVYRQKLRRFSPEQLMELLNKVLEEAKYYPKVSEIYKAAVDLGFFVIDTATTRLHHWQPTECKRCNGEGRLGVFWEYFFEDRDTGRVEVQQLKHVIQYTKSHERSTAYNEIRTLFRCSCSAGDVPTLPKAWPKFSSSTPLRREVWS